MNQSYTWEGTHSKEELKNTRYEIEEEMEEILDSWVKLNWTLLSENINHKINYTLNEFVITMSQEYEED